MSSYIHPLSGLIQNGIVNTGGNHLQGINWVRQPELCRDPNSTIGDVAPDTENQSGNGTLTLAQRLDIAVDIVNAVNYPHNGCQTSVIHCDLKPSNILLTQDMRARVGDFGIARILNEAASRVSGLTLIEMFTGHSPTDNMFTDGLTPHHFAEAALPDNVMEIADSKIWLHDETNNSNATRDITRTKECLAAIIQLGVLCSMQSHRERLSDAAAEMHNIRDTFLSTR
ncbi:hypothetical protein ACP70R_043786 [Stipagrostis hirtigluma subsp. patula]